MGRAVPDNRVHILSVMVIDLGKARVGGRVASFPSFIARAYYRSPAGLAGAHALPNPMGIKARRSPSLDRSRGSTEVARATYGIIQVGIYIAAIQETIDGARQDIEAREKTAPDPPVDIPLKNDEANPNADLGGYSPEGPTRSNKRSKGSGSKGKGKGRHEGWAIRVWEDVAANPPKPSERRRRNFVTILLFA
jgi:hypothetical protein